MKKPVIGSVIPVVIGHVVALCGIGNFEILTNNMCSPWFNFTNELSELRESTPEVISISSWASGTLFELRLPMTWANPITPSTPPPRFWIGNSIARAQAFQSRSPGLFREFGIIRSFEKVGIAWTQMLHYRTLGEPSVPEFYLVEI